MGHVIDLEDYVSRRIDAVPLPLPVPAEAPASSTEPPNALTEEMP